MRNYIFKIKVLLLLVIMSAFNLFTGCKQKKYNTFSKEKIRSSKGTCNTGEFQLIDAVFGEDYNDAISAEIDDRSCSHDYYQKNNFGVYKLSASDNQIPENTSTLQVRLERTTKKLYFENNKYIQIKGTVKIKNVGSVDDDKEENHVHDEDGTYIAQVKGTHNNLRTDKRESHDPAILLFIAKPKRNKAGKGSIILENGKIKEFIIYGELIKKRGGAGKLRSMVYITTVKRDQEFNIDLKTEFYIQNGLKKQRILYTINGVCKSHEIPSENTQSQIAEPIETRIRIGAYRCNGGEADIRWKKNLELHKN